MSVRRVFPVVVVLSLLTALPSEAQFNASWKEWYGNVHAGWTMMEGDAADVVNDGWAFGAGATYYPEDWVAGISLGLDYMDSGIKRAVLDEFEASGGYFTVWGVTAGLTWSPRIEGGVGMYLNGSVGPYRVTGKLTEPGVACGPICPPYSWWCYPGCAPGTIVTASTSTTRIGYSVGVGLTLEVGHSSEIYLEARYFRIETEVATDMIPLVVGLRF